MNRILYCFLRSAYSKCRTHTHAHTHAHTRTDAHTHTHTHAHASTHVMHTHTRKHTHARTHACTRTHARTHTYTHTHTHTHTHIYIYIYILQDFWGPRSTHCSQSSVHRARRSLMDLRHFEKIPEGVSYSPLCDSSLNWPTGQSGSTERNKRL